MASGALALLRASPYLPRASNTLPENRVLAAQRGQEPKLGQEVSELEPDHDPQNENQVGDETPVVVDGFSWMKPSCMGEPPTMPTVSAICHAGFQVSGSWE